MNNSGVHPQGLFDLKSINYDGSLSSAINKSIVDVASLSPTAGDVEVGKIEQLACDSNNSALMSCDK
jgi:hypothetical protein